MLGRVDVYDAGLVLDPARSAEMDELYTTAVVTVDGAAKAVARMKEKHGHIKDWAKAAKKLEHVVESGDHGDGVVVTVETEVVEGTKDVA
ncbi:hypothetical protein F4776DRAFT_661930 [Hypoxylon sp. NC0597]|nr:hypothetical protein F4776DRAFT_661930 [Hypoxylon sp. NC0597]